MPAVALLRVSSTDSQDMVEHSVTAIIHTRAHANVVNKQHYMSWLLTHIKTHNLDFLQCF